MSTISLNTYATGDTDYDSKLTADMTAIAGWLNVFLGGFASYASNTNLIYLLRGLFGAGTSGRLDETGCVAAIVGQTVTLTAGYAYLHTTGCVAYNSSTRAADLTGQPNGTYYITLDVAGVPTFNSSGNDALYSVVKTGSSLGTLTTIAGTLSQLNVPITVKHGGTGLTTVPANQIVIGAGTSALTTITAVNNAVLVTSAGGVPSLSTTLPTAVQDNITRLGTIVSGIWNATAIGVGYGGTNITSYAVGDILYASGSTTLSKLADVATGNALISGGVTTAPAWGKIGLTTHVSGTLAVGNGGTGATAFTANYVPYSNGTILTSSSAFQFNGSVLSVTSGETSAGVLLLSGSASNYVGYGLGRVAQEATLAIADGAGIFAAGAAAGDLVLRVDSASQKVFIGAGATETVTVTSSGVGIGCTPSDKLHVLTDGGASAIRVGGGSANTYPQIKLFTDSTHYNWRISAQDIVDGGLEITPSTAVGGTTFTTPAFVVKSSGNVGIGATVPAEIVHIQKDGTSTYTTATWRNANSTAVLNIGVGGSTVANTPLRNNAYVMNGAASSLLIGTNDTVAMTIDSSQNVGIGTASPGAKLAISGSNSPLQLLNSTLVNQSDIDFEDAQTLRIRTYHASGSTLKFGTNPNGGGNTDRMIIDSNGYIKMASRFGCNGVTPPAQSGHINDPTDLATCQTAIASILDSLEAHGFVATS